MNSDNRSFVHVRIIADGHARRPVSEATADDGHNCALAASRDGVCSKTCETLMHISNK